MIISIVLTHNKDAGNEEQIKEMLALVDDHDTFETVTEIDEKGIEQQITNRTGHYYTLKAMPEHEVKFLHIVPFGVEPPANLYDLDGHKVFYGEGDEDKTGDHPRFYNWGLKRGTDLGGEIVLHVDDVAAFSPKDFKASFSKLASKQDRLNFKEEVWGKASTVELLKTVGQADETKRDPIASLKARITEKGMLHG